ncbi:MAG: Na/Pi cotransporter family protein [Spirochaetes bacterium]|jgi:phosphate:Na+ symporter|nr:Na/Pi cotransporter family protein [Spirochaetota bacterium]
MKTFRLPLYSLILFSLISCLFFTMPLFSEESEPQTRTVALNVEDDSLVNLKQFGISVTLPQTNVITGTVRLHGKESPLRGIDIVYTDKNGFEHTLKSNRDGQFTLINVAYPYTVRAAEKEYILRKASIEMSDEQITHLTLVMNKKANIFAMIFSIVGGLGIFLLGMRYMSEGLQTVSGPTLKRMIGLVTNNRFLATIVGVGVTTVVQSSSLTTVMAVGFVNSGIMALHQAIGVILGANIGTTITGWILVLDIGKWGLPIIGIFAFLYLFTRKEKIRYIAFTIMGVGMIFFGLELMKDGFQPLRLMSEFEALFALFHATSYLNVLKIAFIGCILTMIVQSSSATLGITIGLAQTGVINFETAAALVLGENIGTTITALLASIGTSTNARRAAYFHTLFNLTGVLWITAVFQWYLPLVRSVVGHDPNTVVMSDGSPSYPYVTAGIATVHTIFNIVNTLLFLPFTRVLASFLTRMVKESKVKTGMVTKLQQTLLSSPFAAVQQTKFEIIKMEQVTRGMLNTLKAILSGEKRSQSVINSIFKDEEKLDSMQSEITEFLTDLMSEPLPIEVAEECKEHLRMCDELESVSDYIAQILKLILRLQDNDTHLSESQIANIMELHDEVKKFFNLVRECERNQTIQAEYDNICAVSEEITSHIRAFRNEHWENASLTKMSPLVNTAYTDILQAYRKIKNHMLNSVEVQAL